MDMHISNNKNLTTVAAILESTRNFRVSLINLFSTVSSTLHALARVWYDRKKLQPHPPDQTTITRPHVPTKEAPY